MSTKPLTTPVSGNVAVVGVPKPDILKDSPANARVIAVGAPSGIHALSKQEQHDLLKAAIKQFDNLY